MNKRERIPLGNGKYCYSGPDCRKHGRKTEEVKFIESLIEPKIFDEVENMIKKNIPEWEQQEKQYLCEKSSQNSEKINETIAESLIENNRAYRWCEIHQTNHIYEKRLFIHNIEKKQEKSLNINILKIFKENKMKLENLRTMFLYSIKYKNNITSQSMIKDTQNLENMVSVEFYKGYLKRREEIKEQAYKISLASDHKSQTPAKVRPEIKLLSPSENFSDEVVLRYWKCGRKKRFVSQEQAKIAQIKINDNNLSEYSCPYCQGFHNGHGLTTGLASTEVQIVKGREHWDTNPKLANNFITQNNLM